MQIPKDTQNNPQLPKITKNHSKPTKTTQKESQPPKPPTISRNHHKPPKTSPAHLKISQRNNSNFPEYNVNDIFSLGNEKNTEILDYAIFT